LAREVKIGPMVWLEAFPQHKSKKGEMKNEDGKT
jgi:hypothetical protein